MIQSSFRPTFLIRSLLQASGQPRTDTSTIPGEAERFAMGVPGSVEYLWTSFESLILSLTLAGYDCPEIVLASPSWGDPVRDVGYLRLYPHSPVVFYDAGDWRARTGVSVGSDAWTVYLIRVTVRRTLGAPSLYPPVSLTGAPGYTRRPDSTDRFRDPADGWITLVGTKPLESSPSAVATALGEPIRAFVSAALADAWTRDSGGAVGLLRSLNPLFWETPNDRDLPVREFVSLAREVWTFLEEPTQLRAFLAADAADPAASLNGLRRSAGATTSRAKALSEMKSRMRFFYPRHAAVDTLPDDWKRQHWALTLFELHEFGLLRILPFPLGYEVRISGVDLTGWYETVADAYSPATGTIPRIATMQLNQAGDIIVGWWYTARFERWDIGAQLPAAPGGSGPLSVTALFMRPERDTGAVLSGIPASDGSAEDVDFTLDVTFDGVTYRMIRRSRLAQVSPADRLAAVPPDAPPVGEGFLASAHFLSELGISRAIDVLVEGVLDVSASSTLSWPDLMADVEEDLRTTLADNNILTYTGAAVPPSPMLDRFQVEARGALTATLVPSADGRDAWNQLHAILNVLDVTSRATAEALRALLDIGSNPPHEYTLQFGGVGLIGEVDEGFGATAGGMYILGRIHHETTTCGGNPAGWPGWYWGVVLEGGGSEGAEFGGGVNIIRVADPDTIWAPSEWFPDDFATLGLSIPARCAFATLGGGGEAHGRAYIGVEGGWDVIEATVFVSRTAKSIAAGWNDGWFVSAGVGVSGGVGLAGGFSFGLLTGRVGGTGNPGPQEPPPPAPPVILLVDGTQNVSFDTDQAAPNAWGLARLAQCVAKYRALFESPLSTIVIEGDASPAGPVAYNETLSWKRALAIYAEIRGLLSAPATGDFGELRALNVGESGVELTAFGEVQARISGIPDGLDPDEWRRVKIIINGSVAAFI